jgi:hypothetical protein
MCLVALIRAAKLGKFGDANVRLLSYQRPEFQTYYQNITSYVSKEKADIPDWDIGLACVKSDCSEIQ